LTVHKLIIAKELNPRRRVYVEIPKPSRVELKCSQNPEVLAKGFDVILVTPERVLVSQHRPDAEGFISILKCLKAKSYVLSTLPGRVLVELPRPSANVCTQNEANAFSL
jgi:hypothetical protein